MLVRKPTDLTYADVTPKSVYSNRRKFLRGAGLAFIGAFAGKRRLAFVAPDFLMTVAFQLFAAWSAFVGRQLVCGLRNDLDSNGAQKERHAQLAIEPP